MTEHSERPEQGKQANHGALVLTPVQGKFDILPEYRHTPIADLLTTHNLKRAVSAEAGSMVIVTCMDFRVLLRLPEQSAFVIRTAGAAIEPALSNIAFAVSAAGVRTLAIIGHTDCAMTRTEASHEPFMQHMTEAEGWTRERSDMMFDNLHRIFAIHDPVQATYERALWLQQQFPSCLVAPLLYRVEDHTIVQISVAANDAT